MSRRRPAPTEYHEYYTDYVNAVPDGDIIEILTSARDESVQLFESIPEEKLDFRYAEGKWSTREIIGHITDAEWVFMGRALRFARGDETPLPDLDEQRFMAGANFGDRSLASLITEFRHLRTAGIALFDSFDDDTFGRTGVASNCTFTVRALAYIVAGHSIHHARVLRERYL